MRALKRLAQKRSRRKTSLNVFEGKVQEVHGVIENDTFETVHKSSIEDSTHIFESKFVDPFKTTENGFQRSRHVLAQIHGCDSTATIATKVLTRKRFTKCLTLTLEARPLHISILTRNITRANNQTHTLLELYVDLQPQNEIGLPPNSVMEVKTLYGITESGLYRYLSYPCHQIDDLNML